MSSPFKEKGKLVLKKLGLQKAAISIVNFCLSIDLTQITKWFGFYIFNFWITNFPIHFVRILYLKYILRIKIGKRTFIHMGCFFEGNNTIIGDNNVIGRWCFFGGGGTITVGNNVSITSKTYIFSSTHDVNSPSFAMKYTDVVIEDYVWIGANAMVMPGVKIEKGAMLAAMSTATKNIPPYTIFGGTPAKEIAKRSSELNYSLNYSPYFN